MLLPNEWAILTVMEARILIEYIEKSTATKSSSKNFDKMQKVGILEMYNKLREFLEVNAQYEALKNMDIN